MQKMTGRACKETQAMQQTSGGSAPRIVEQQSNQPEAGPSNCKTCRNESSHEANDPLPTVDADDRPHGASSPHGSAGQSSEHVVASAPWLRRQVNNVDPQEHEESQTRNSSDASEVCGGLQTHTSSETTQGTPPVVPDMHRPATDAMGVTATSHGSGIERTVQQEYHSAMLRDESPMPGPKAAVMVCPPNPPYPSEASLPPPMVGPTSDAFRSTSDPTGSSAYFSLSLTDSRMFLLAFFT